MEEKLKQCRNKESNLMSQYDNRVFGFLRDSSKDDRRSADIKLLSCTIYGQRHQTVWLDSLDKIRSENKYLDTINDLTDLKLDAQQIESLVNIADGRERYEATRIIVGNIDEWKDFYKEITMTHCGKFAKILKQFVAKRNAMRRSSSSSSSDIVLELVLLKSNLVKIKCTIDKLICISEK
ncbi:pkip [Spodoptera littoralis nucleopolyhedrovirus]|uniref:Pkip n=1 Tax=Spodoptera littoralis nuclear polyhedrosis virus TaxID=10456 RepID=M1JTK2_NPVSL|nr:pkip [Spodoptera littoralis nucleopolyhedrovirus]AGE89980.1 pkip [Spodoptera littoralis nucleopolyhedrovirus]AYU75312.1 pkip [Spodoptera littoralis nucleopolyhedrovirus]